MRQTIVAANWKMNGSLKANQQLLEALQADTNNLNVEILVCPPAVYLNQVQKLLTDSSIKLGAQNMSAFEKGAYTGENSANMLQEFECQYVLLGHSERRSLYAEKDADVAKKFKAALAAGLTPVLCVGETLEQREAGDTLKVISQQINTVLAESSIADFAKAVIAYEPVWAIGTGKTASPEQAQEVHQAIRILLATQDARIAEQTSILYGGSVNAANAQSLFAQADVDGGLVGGASLIAEDFIAICRTAAVA